MRKSNQTVIAVVTLTVLLGIVITTSALAQTDEGGTTESDEKITFTWGDTSEPSSLNPMSGYLATDFYAWIWTYHLPFQPSTKDFSPVPDAVTEVQQSEDGMEFTYTVAEGIKWSDGEDLTAEDVAFTMNLYKDNHAYLPQNYLTLIDGDVEAVDDTHIRFRTTEPTSLYSGDVWYLYNYILPEHVYSELEKPKQFDNVPSVGSGPFFIAEYKTGEFIRLERNEFWNGPEPGVDEVIYRIYKSEDAEAQALKSGEIDFGYFDSANIFNSLDGQPDITTHWGTVPVFDELGMNSGSAFQEADPPFEPHGDGHPALQDPVLRRAIRMAINSEELVEKVQLGYGAPGDSIIPPVSVPGARWEPTGEEVLAWDIDGANQLLEDAGYVDSDDDGVREMPNGGEPLEFRYYVQSNDQNTTKAAPFISDWLKDIGIATEVTVMSSGRLGDEINAGTYDLFHWGWYPDPDPDSALSWFTCDQRPPEGKTYGNNDSYYCNPQYDELFDQQRTTLDLEERWQIVHEMQRIYYQDAAYAVLWYAPTFQAYRTDRFTGFKPQPSPRGDLLNGYSRNAILSIQPAGVGGGTSTTAKGISAGVWIAIVAGAIVLIVGGILLTRRRTSDEDQA